MAWSLLQPQDRLKTLFEHVLAKSHEADAWYQEHKKFPQAWSRWIRALVVLLGTLGGLAPIVAGMRHSAITPEIAGIISQCGYLLIGCAAGLLAFDRYFGLSSAWLRYVTAIMELQRLEVDFLLDWSGLLLIPLAPDGVRDFQPFLERASRFWLAVVDLVAKETDAWSREFQAAAADLEKLVQAGREQALKRENQAREAMEVGKHPPGPGKRIG